MREKRIKSTVKELFTDHDAALVIKKLFQSSNFGTNFKKQSRKKVLSEKFFFLEKWYDLQKQDWPSCTG